MSDVKKIKTGFYEWLQQDAEREVESDLYFLKQMKGQLGIKAFYYFNSLKSQDQRDVLLSLTTKFLIHNSKAIGLSPSEQDKNIWNSFEEEMFKNPIYAEILDPYYTEELWRIRKKNDFKLLRREIKKACSSHLGTSVKDTSRMLLYEKKIENFVVTTEFELGGTRQLSCLHSVFHQNKESDTGEPVITTDFLRWLGIGGTDWELMTNDEILQTVSTLSELTYNFMEGITNTINA